MLRMGAAAAHADGIGDEASPIPRCENDDLDSDALLHWSGRAFISLYLVVWIPFAFIPLCVTNFAATFTARNVDVTTTSRRGRHGSRNRTPMHLTTLSTFEDAAQAYERALTIAVGSEDHPPPRMRRLEAVYGSLRIVPRDRSASSGDRAPPGCIDQLRVISPEEFPDSCARDCCICVSDFEIGDDIVFTPCEHAFHKGCMRECLERSRLCPLCRTDLPRSLGMDEGRVSPRDDVAGGERMSLLLGVDLATGAVYARY